MIKLQYFILLGMTILIGWSFYAISNPPNCDYNSGFCGFQYLNYANPYMFIIIMGIMFVVLPTGLSLCESKVKPVNKITERSSEQ